MTDPERNRFMTWTQYIRHEDVERAKELGFIIKDCLGSPHNRWSQLGIWEGPEPPPKLYDDEVA